LVRLGVRMIWVGVESKSNAHSKTRGIDLKALFRELKEKGIVVQASTILFQDHHDEQTIHEDIDWVIGLDSDLVQFMNYTPYPSTSLYAKLEDEGRLKDVDYRHQHGQGELVFDHPHFTDPRDHARILREAFRKKYRTAGPGILNMAITAVTGYRRARNDYEDRKARGLAWNPETLRYEPSEKPEPDRFMRHRVRVMRLIAANVRPVLLPAWVFAPNRQSRAKARDAMRLFDEVLGKATWSERVRGLGLVATGALEAARTALGRLFGRESIVRQPPMRCTVYPRDHRTHASQPLPHGLPVTVENEE
ncbi:MAG: hypothetical protein QG656_2051, partial [Candidatus Hydrogenedentes bacterium]|nr:hypothetical protein [Candidatus Hydrogenedentota bacterium]